MILFSGWRLFGLCAQRSEGRRERERVGGRNGEGRREREREREGGKGGRREGGRGKEGSKQSFARP